MGYDKLLPLGNVHDFADLCVEDINIVIINDIVHAKTAPSGLHELAGTSCNLMVFLLRQKFGGCFHAFGSTDQYYVAKHATTILHVKQPDSSIKISRREKFNLLRGRQEYPIFVSEAAYTHESLHDLLVEGSNWLNEATDVQYCLLWKTISITETFAIHIYVVSRMLPSIEDLVQKNVAGTTKQEDIQQFGMACRPIEKPDFEHATIQELQDLYQFIIHQQIVITPENFDNDGNLRNVVVLNFDAIMLLGRTNFVVDPEDAFISIDVTETIEEIYDEYLRNRRRREQ